MDDVASGALQYLATFPAITTLLGVVTANDPVSGNRGLPLLFRENLLADLKGTGASAIVCSNAGGWGSAVPYATQRFSRLQVDIYTDSARDAGYNATGSPGQTVQRCEKLFSQVQSVLHRTDPQAVVWGDLVTVQCTLLAEGQTRPSQDGDWMQQKTIFYGVMHTGWLDVVLL